jgi:hypothetical protein
VNDLSVDIDPYLPPKYEQYRIGDSSKVTQFKPKLEEWRDRCLQTHPSSKCSKPPKARAKFPTRLVQVGDPVKVNIPIFSYHTIQTSKYQSSRGDFLLHFFYFIVKD